MLKLESSDKMYSIRELYRIGRGPSSSHTMGPSYACQRAMDETPAADGYEVTLLGSLAKTGYWSIGRGKKDFKHGLCRKHICRG